MNPYIPVAPHGIDPSLAVGITNPGGPNPMDGNVLLCSVSFACLPNASMQTQAGCTHNKAADYLTLDRRPCYLVYRPSR